MTHEHFLTASRLSAGSCFERSKLWLRAAERVLQLENIETPTMNRSATMSRDVPTEAQHGSEYPVIISTGGVNKTGIGNSATTS